MKTPKVTQPKRLQDHHRVKNFVNRPGAKLLWRVLHTKPHSTQMFLTELLAVASEAGQGLDSQVKRHALKSTVAAIWECVRYGWQQAAFGRNPDPRATLGELKCRRTVVLMRRAVTFGAEIARRQASADM